MTRGQGRRQFVGVMIAATLCGACGGAFTDPADRATRGGGTPPLSLSVGVGGETAQ